MSDTFLEQETQTPQDTHSATCAFFTSVTSFSKILAAVLFIALPFVGFLVGLEYGTSLATHSYAPPVSSHSPGFQGGVVSTSTDPSSVAPTTSTTGQTGLNTGLSTPSSPDDVVPDKKAPKVGSCAITNCHGLEISCGIVTEQIECTMMYQLGDGCRRFASCEQVGSTCAPVLSQRFNDCKSCVEACETRHKSDEDPMGIFECESACVE